jgi:hypothetical protein
MRSLFVILFSIFLGLPSIALAGEDYDYQLYKNHEKYGIVVFPKKNIFKDLDDYLKSIPFEITESGKAVMRHGSKKENATYMMPLEVQKKHSIEKFIVIQILGDNNSMLAGIYDPQWGLTLPSTIYQLEAVKKNILKTLNVFRGNNHQRQTRRFTSENTPKNTNFSTSEYNIIDR